jgi:hypothetical protein
MAVAKKKNCHYEIAERCPRFGFYCNINFTKFKSYVYLVAVLIPSKCLSKTLQNILAVHSVKV